MIEQRIEESIPIKILGVHSVREVLSDLAAVACAAKAAFFRASTTAEQCSLGFCGAFADGR